VPIPPGVTKVAYHLRVTPDPVEDTSPMEIRFEAPTKLVLEDGVVRGAGRLRIDGYWDAQQHDELLQAMADAARDYMAATWPHLTVAATRRYTAENYPDGDTWPPAEEPTAEPTTP
jgi:hypothetical protein